jgi:hypothetical protein
MIEFDFTRNRMQNQRIKELKMFSSRKVSCSSRISLFSSQMVTF